MKYVYQHNVDKLAQFGNRVFDLDINLNNLEETALQAIHCLEQFFKDLKENPKSANDAMMKDEFIAGAFKKLVAAGIIKTK